MDPTRFDRLTKLFAERRLSRRQALATGGAGLAAGIAGVAGLAATAQQATPLPSSAAGFGQEFLFVQSASSGTFISTPQLATPSGEGRPVPAGQFLLTLEEHSGQTIYFSDRPERITGGALTDLFLESLGFTSANPPNAAIVVGGGPDADVLVVELFNPDYDPETGQLSYQVNVLGTYEGEGLARIGRTTGRCDTAGELWSSLPLYRRLCRQH